MKSPVNTRQRFREYPAGSLVVNIYIDVCVCGQTLFSKARQLTYILLMSLDR